MSNCERKRIYLMVGLTGSGKSTTSNSIINKKGDLDSLKRPFETSDSASGCTINFQIHCSEYLSVVDTVGFGDPQFKGNNIYEELKRGLSEVQNRVTHVIYVVKKSRFTNEVVQFFELVQDKVLKNKCRHNSFILFTDCPKGWVDRQTNQDIKQALSNCNHKFYEYFLKFDSENDDEDDSRKNKEKREKSVQAFLEYLDTLQFSEIDLSYVQSTEFKDEWYKHIMPLLGVLLRALFPKLRLIGNPIGNLLDSNCRTS
jgi:GTPase Era involved in 16S rRNA processing